MEKLLIVQEDGSVISPSAKEAEAILQNIEAYEQFDLGGLIILSEKRSEVRVLSAQIAQMIADEGLTIDMLLKGLREERRRYVEEVYGI